MFLVFLVSERSTCLLQPGIIVQDGLCLSDTVRRETLHCARHFAEKDTALCGETLCGERHCTVRDTLREQTLHCAVRHFAERDTTLCETLCRERHCTVQ